MTLDIPALRAKYDAATQGATDAAFLATDKYEIDGETWSRIFLHWDDEKCVMADMMTDGFAAYVVAAHAAFPELLAMAAMHPSVFQCSACEEFFELTEDRKSMADRLEKAEAEKVALAERLDRRNSVTVRKLEIAMKALHGIRNWPGDVAHQERIAKAFAAIAEVKP